MIIAKAEERVSTPKFVIPEDIIEDLYGKLPERAKHAVRLAFLNDWIGITKLNISGIINQDYGTPGTVEVMLGIGNPSEVEQFRACFHESGRELMAHIENKFDLYQALVHGYLLGTAYTEPIRVNRGGMIAFGIIPDEHGHQLIGELRRWFAIMNNISPDNVLITPSLVERFGQEHRLDYHQLFTELLCLEYDPTHEIRSKCAQRIYTMERA